MKPLARFLYVLTILYLPLFLLAACISQNDADNANGIIDTFVNSVADVAGALIPGAGAAVHAGGALGKLIVTALVAGPPAAAAVTYKLKGGAFTPSGRRAKREEDQMWDRTLEHAESLATAAQTIAKTGNHEHVGKQAEQALAVVAALKAKQKKPRKAAVRPTPQEGD